MGTLLKSFKKIQIDNFIESVSNTSYYVFASKILPWPDDRNPPTAFESYQDSIYDVQNQLIFGKRITASNIQYLARRINWSSNTIYDRFDANDISIFTKNFFVITTDNNVYKCLNNNSGNLSTIKPNLMQNSTFTTSDGYLWKYLYTVADTDMLNFGSNYFIPIVPNTQITLSAVSGIEFVEVVAGGNGYITSTNGLVQGAISNNTIIQIENTASFDNDFYDNCAFYTTSGPSVGSLRTIVNYSVNSTGKWVTLNSNIPDLVVSQTTYEINPRIVITGDGTGATAISRTSNGVITDVITLSPGQNYTRANISIVANNSYGSSANVVTYIGVPGGHGSDLYSELGCDAFGIYMTFSNNDPLPIISNTEYRTIGVLSSPTYPNTAIVSANTFDQTLVCNTTPSIQFGQGNYVIGHDTNSKAYVAFSNSSVLLLVGDKNFGNNEVINEYFSDGFLTGKSSQINTIIKHGDIDQNSPKILYYTNVIPVERSVSTSEVIKLSIQV